MPFDKLNLIEKSSDFKPNELKAQVIKNEKVIFIHSMQIKASEVKSYSKILFTNNKQFFS